MSIDERKAYVGKTAVIDRFGQYPHDYSFTYYKKWRGRQLKVVAVDHKGMCYLEGLDINGRLKTVMAELWRLKFGNKIEQEAEEF